MSIDNAGDWENILQMPDLDDILYAIFGSLGKPDFAAWTHAVACLREFYSEEWSTLAEQVLGEMAPGTDCDELSSCLQVIPLILSTAVALDPIPGTVRGEIDSEERRAPWTYFGISREDYNAFRNDLEDVLIAPKFLNRNKPWKKLGTTRRQFMAVVTLWKEIREHCAY
jgi:hypothetical protein